MNSLELGLIGNGTISALITQDAEVTWACFPRFDGDPAFCSLLGSRRGTNDGTGFHAIEMLGMVRSEQSYLENTPILVTRMYDESGGILEVTDFAPRFEQYARIFCPMTLVRRITQVAGHPRVRVRLRPACKYGRFPTERTYGSNHIRYIGGDVVLRLTTDAALTPILEETPFFVDGTITMLLGPDETVQDAAGIVGRRFLEETAAHWRDWVRALAIPFEWQDAVIRSAIALKLNAHQDTGAVVAAMTTSIPESDGSSRNWDYRFCWIRDAYFVVDALNRLGATHTMERYLAYILNVIANAGDGTLQPLYNISGQSDLQERIVDSLPGYRGMGPVRVGNEAYLQIQHDVYGAAILGATHVFFDKRLENRGDEALFLRLEVLGHHAAELYDKPDAGIWELRGSLHVHTFSSVMCWAGCDRLARIADELGFAARRDYWRAKADMIHAEVCRRCWNEEMGTFVATMDGNTLDASLLRMQDVGFIAPLDPRFIGTVNAVERDLRRGNHIYRYLIEDDFGRPENAFLACTFWFINALAAIGREQDARELFEHVLTCRNGHGLLAEHIDPQTNEQWGNFVQTYSMVGIISSALRLSIPWDRGF